jgi:hypothetical protein
VSEKGLTGVISEVVDLLVECSGSEPKIRWLRARQSMLEEPNLDGRTRSNIEREICQHISGMNGLIDQYLVPPPGSLLDEAAANERLHALADELYELITRS